MNKFREAAAGNHISCQTTLSRWGGVLLFGESVLARLRAALSIGLLYPRMAINSDSLDLEAPSIPLLRCCRLPSSRERVCL